MGLHLSGSTVASLSNAFVQHITPISGESQTAATSRVNAALAAASAFGSRRRVRLTGDWTFNGPLVVYSDTELDTTGAVLTLASNSNSNGIINQAVLNTRRVMDAVTTNGSTTVTSATAAFVSGDVGKTFRVHNPGYTTGYFETTIASVTNGTTAVLAAAPPVSGTAQYAYIGSRDSNIVLRLGRLIRSTGNYVGVANGWLSHHLRFRHVDNLHIPEIHNIVILNGKYAVNFGDCANLRVGRVYTSSTSSDVVHFNGPISGAMVDEVVSEGSGDDIVSMTGGDFTTVHQLADCQGDIKGVRIKRIVTKPSTSTGRACLILAGRNSDQTINYSVSRIRVDSVDSQLVTYPVWIGADTQDNNTQGGSYSDINICPGGGYNSTTGTPPTAFVRFRDQTVTRAFVGPVYNNGGTYDILVDTPVTVTDLTVSGVKRTRIQRLGTVSGQLRILGEQPYGGIQSTKSNAPVYTLDRRSAKVDSVTLPSGTVEFTYFRVNESVTFSNFLTKTRSPAAAGPTLTRVGVYEVNNPTPDDLTLLAATSAADTTLWNGTFQGVGRAIAASGSVTLDPMKTYAVAVLFVGTTAPGVMGLQLDGSEASQNDRLCMCLTGQTDLPATVGWASLQSSEGKAIYVRMS